MTRPHRRKRGKQPPVVPQAPSPAPEEQQPPTPARGARLAVVLGELHRAQHRAALAEHLSSRVFTDYLAEDAPARFLIQVGDGPPVQADSDAAIELSALLVQTAEVARLRVHELLALEFPGGGNPNADAADEQTDALQFDARVVRADVAVPRGAQRR